MTLTYIAMKSKQPFLLVAFFVLFSWLIQQQLADGSLVEVLPHLASEGLPIHLAWIKNRQALPRVSTLLQVLAAELTAR